MKLTRDKKEKGQSLVELAFGLMALLLLVAGIVDLGRAFFAYMALRDAAQEGALYGSIHPADNWEIENRVRTSSSNPVDLTDMTNVQVPITKSDVCSNGNGTDWINVRVTYDFPVITPFMGAIIGSQSFTLSADITDMILAPQCP